MIRKKSKNLIKYLSQFKDSSVEKTMNDLKLNKDSLRYEINLINRYLEDLNHPNIEIINNKVIVFDEFSAVSSELVSYINSLNLIPAAYRKYALIIYIFLKQDWLSLSHLESLLDLSKNSVLSELKNLRDYIKQYEVTLETNRIDGYYLSGKEENVIQLAELAMSELSNIDNGLSIVQEIMESWDLDYNRDEIVKIIDTLAKAYDVAFVLERFDDFVNSIMLLSNRQSDERLAYDQDKVDYIKHQPLYTLGLSISEQLQLVKDETDIFTTVRLLGALQGSQYLSPDPNLIRISKEIVARVKAVTLSSFSSVDTQILEKNLYEHLVPCYFRVKFDIPTINPLTETIKESYMDLFILVKRCLEPFETYVNKKLTDDELSYFTIHFGGQLINEMPARQDLRVITICPNGISSSLVLNSQLQNMFPTFNFLGVYTTKQLDLVDEDKYDVIFTTVPIKTRKPHFVVRSVMNDLEREILKQKVQKEFNLADISSNVSIEDVIKVVKKYADVNNEDALYQAIGSLLYPTSNEREGKNLDDLLINKLIQFTDQQLDWREGIRLASKPLLDNGYIEDRYVDAMIQRVEEIGPYIVIAPKVAIPHARPEEGTLKIGMSLLHSEKPIIFDEEDEDSAVHLMFVLSGTDNTSHLKALQQLSTLLEDEADTDSMIAIKDVDELISFIKNKIERMED